jgi:hypothetical protein
MKSQMNVYKITISRVSNIPPTQGEIYAADPTSLTANLASSPGNIIAKFCRLDVFDEEGSIGDTFWADTQGRWPEQDPEAIFNARTWDVRRYERQDVGTIMWVGDDADYGIDSEKWVGGVGEIVDVSIIKQDRLAGALAVSVQPFYNVFGSLSSADDWGV